MSGNPFAPTPIGKDWTPPQEPATPRTEPAAAGETADLTALFDEQATGTVSQEAEDAQNLSSLFADSVTPVVPVEEPIAVRPRSRRRGLPADLQPAAGTGEPPEPRLLEPTTGDAPTRAGRSPRIPAPPARDEETPVVPPARRDPAPTATRDHDTTRSGGAAPDHAATHDLRTEADPADALRTAPAPRRGVRPTARLALFARSQSEIENVWNAVDRAMSLVQSDITLQGLVSHLTLTQDLVEYTRQRHEVHAALRQKMAAAGLSLSGFGDVEAVLDLILDELIGISVLGEFFRDPEITEILVDRWDVISVERDGALERTGLTFRSPQHAESTARGLALKISDRAVSRAIPLVTAELPSARITFAFGSVVKGGLSITIRKFRPLLGLDDLLRYRSLDEEMVAFLREAVLARVGILVSGGTGTGKTTIINLLSTFIPDSERVITIEDAFELKLANTHVVSLQTKEASSLDDTVSVRLADLLRNTLRMRPDRIIVGEIREGEGALVMLSAASTGHDGTLTTIHANNADAALNERLPDLIRQERSGLDTNVILRSIAAAFDLVVQVGRTRDGRRYLSEISAVTGVDEDAGRIVLAPVFVGHVDGDAVRFERRALRSDTELAKRLAAEGGN